MQPDTTSPVTVSNSATVAVPKASGLVVYAGFWSRFGAFILDAIILGVVGFAVGFIFGVLSVIIAGPDTTNSLGMMIRSLGSIIAYAIQVVYMIYFIGAKGQTPGKMILKIKVVKVGTNEAPGYLKAFLREVVGKFISSFVLLLGFLWMLWDKNKQAWHDKIAGTVVVKV